MIPSLIIYWLNWFIRKGKEMKKYIRYIVYISLFCSIALGLGYFWKNTASSAKKAEKENAISIKAMPIKGQDIVIQRDYIGYVEAIHQVEIVPFISGYLQDILVSPGQLVHEKEPLLTIDSAEYKAKLDAAEAAVLQEKSSFEYNKNYYERIKKSGGKAFSEIDRDNAKNNFLQSEAMLKNAQANKDVAAINYAYTHINAPITGLIGNFTLSKGDYVTPTQSLPLNIIQTDPIRVVFSLTDKEYLTIKNDDPPFKDTVIKLKTADGSVYDYEGEFKYTDNKINRQTDSLAVYTYFKNDKGKLLPNAFVTIELFKTFKDSVLIKKDFTFKKNHTPFVIIYRQNEFIAVPLKILTDLEMDYVVKNNFKSDDLLVLNREQIKASDIK